MSYDLDALARDAAPVSIDLPALAAAIHAREPQLTPRAGADCVRCDGAGFTVVPLARGARLSAGPRRGEHDERAMELAALLLAGPDGEVIDRHTGRHWPAALLAEWLRVAGLLSGRALALNAERIAHERDPVAARGFTTRIEALCAHANTPAPNPASAAFTARLHDELAHYAARAGLVWPVARARARLGDFAGLAALTRTPAVDGDPDAFAVAAEYGAAALPLFENALADTDPNYRRAAARVLHQLRTPAVLPLVARALVDRRSTVRESVLDAEFAAVLALPGARLALDPVLQRLTHDSSTIVRRLATRLLR